MIIHMITVIHIINMHITINSIMVVTISIISMIIVHNQAAE